MLVYNSLLYMQWNAPIKHIFQKTGVLNHRRKWLTILRRCYAKDVHYETPIEYIRNFSIIAHVDHGKSTLADRLLEMTGAIKKDSGKQVLDKLQVEKERGITVKAQTASLKYIYEGKEYLLNLIDTPGHVDFSSEVQRSLAPCQGVILLVDANDGVQAQTVANYHLAREKNLIIIPVINKIDLKNAKPERVIDQLENVFDIPGSDVLKISAKLGTGVDELFRAIVERIPPPVSVDRSKPFRAIRFDSWFDKYRGAVSLIYVVDGSISVGNNITSSSVKKNYEVKGLWLLRPDEEPVTKLHAGQVGCLICNIRTSKEAVIGDTLCLKNSTAEPIAAFKLQRSMVFAGVYPPDQSQFPSLQNAVEKLALNDSGVTITPESSSALGRGWRIGFLGMLHMEVFVQRLEQEYDAEPIVTAPSVTYKAKIFGSKNIVKYKGEMISFNNPNHFPDPQIVKEFYEPIILGTIITPDEYVAEIAMLCREKRGTEKSIKSIGNNRSIIQFYLPLNEVVVDFYDTLKSKTSGYASFDYEDHDYVVSDIVKLKIILNGTVIEELATIVHRSRADYSGRRLCQRLTEIIPRQQYEVVIQAAIGSKILARETLKAYRKDVTAKLYGGDITRRRKLLAQQAEGKKQMKMRSIGNIKIPRETFIEVLKK